jgi:hypothetical protein
VAVNSNRIMLYDNELRSSVSSAGEISPKNSEVVLSDLTKSGGTNFYLLHEVLLQAQKKHCCVAL